jgi:hypothetical protein
MILKRKKSFELLFRNVMPAKAGIYKRLIFDYLTALDSCLRRNDTLFSRMFQRTRKIRHFIITLILLTASVCNAELLMDTRGQISFAPYIQGVKKTEGFYPGYRTDFIADVDFLRFGSLTLNGLIGNMTMISRTSESIFNLDKIQYVLSPGVRFEHREIMITGQFNHESIYAISRADDQQGAFWQNSGRLIVQSKGASYLFLRDEYKNINNEILNSWDGILGVGLFLHGSNSIWVAKNQDYRQELFSNIRYHFGVYKNYVNFNGLQYHLWRNADKTVEQKLTLTLNLFRNNTDGFFGIYYRFVIYDNSEQDNEKGLGMLGLQIVF